VFCFIFIKIENCFVEFSFFHFKNMRISFTVQAVYDVFASPDKGFARQRPWLANCGGVLAWE
jgi:hypothetical protein